MKIQYVCAFLLTTLVVSVMCQHEENERYIVQLKEGATDEQIEEVIQLVEGHESLPREELFIESDNTLLPMFYGEISEETAEKISELDIVEVVEKDGVVVIEKNLYESKEFFIDDLENSEFSTKTPLYNLDIIDEKENGCTDGTYQPVNYGKGADIYILDTGINYDHQDFRKRDGSAETRAMYGGYDAVDAARGTNQRGRDCQGHGTHCAGTAGGLFSGVAKDANIYSIRVLSCRGSGYWSWIINGLRYVYYIHRAKSARPGFVGTIVSMSLGGRRSSGLNNIINAVVKRGITVVTASGNEKTYACRRSPGSAGLNINVGAHGYDPNTCKKPMASFSNFGSCVDIVAPGVRVISTSYKSNTGYTAKSGTSMACPHVAGGAAIVLAGMKGLTPAQVKDNIKTNGVGDIDRSGMSSTVRSVSFAKRFLTKSD